MPIQPSNVAIIKAAPLVAKVQELSRSRGDNAKFKEPRFFPELVLNAVRRGENEIILDPENEGNNEIRDAIIVAFMLGALMDE